MSKHIVAKRVNNQLHPSTVPIQHDSYSKALTEAERLASANPGVEFVVLSESHSVKVDADIPTSSLYKQGTPPGLYQFVRFGDGTNCENGKPMPFAAWVGPADPCNESNPVVFLDCNNKPVPKPTTRNLRWKLKA